MSAFGGKADVNHETPECPLIAISGHKDEGYSGNPAFRSPFWKNPGFLAVTRMSAFGYKRKFWGPLIFVRFTPQSRHNLRLRQRSAYDPKRT